MQPAGISGVLLLPLLVPSLYLLFTELYEAEEELFNHHQSSFKPLFRQGVFLFN
jgi:hypothetical protein